MKKGFCVPVWEGCWFLGSPMHFHCPFLFKFNGVLDRIHSVYLACKMTTHPHLVGFFHHKITNSHFLALNMHKVS